MKIVKLDSRKTLSNSLLLSLMAGKPKAIGEGDLLETKFRFSEVEVVKY